MEHAGILAVIYFGKPNGSKHPAKSYCLNCTHWLEINKFKSTKDCLKVSFGVSNVRLLRPEMHLVPGVTSLNMD